MRILDLFCKAGGASTGYVLAGFEVVGVDIEPQPRYPFDFFQGDALELLWKLDLGEFDAIHASPPCQAHTRARGIQGREHPDLLPETREALRSTGLPYLIENVLGAPLIEPTVLCGAGFGLPFCRHRLFETSWTLGTLVPPCGREQVLYAPEHVHHARDPESERGRRRVRGVQVFGHSFRLDSGREALQMPWASRNELAEAIPPVFTEFLGADLARHIEREREVRHARR